MLLTSLLILQFHVAGAAGVAAGASPVAASPVTASPVPSSPVTAAPAAIWGGDVRALAVHPRDPDVLAAGTSAGHIYLSRDGGRSWSDAGAPLPFPDWVVGTLRFDPHRPDRLWAALWGVWGSGLVAVSDDLGATWRERMGPSGGSGRALPREPVYDLVVEPGAPDLLYAGARSGVWLSRDAGLGWIHLTAPYPEIHHVSSLLVHPERPGTLIAGTWRRAYRSDDGGLTWRGAFTGMELDSEVFQLRSVPGRERDLWASTCGWVYLSSDLGERWTRFKDGLPERRTPAFAVLEDGRLLAGTIAGLYVSEDAGRSWELRTDPELSVRAIVHDPRRPERIVLGTEGAGVWLSTDGGLRFEPSSRGMTNVRVEAVAALPGEAPSGNGAGGEVLAEVRHAGPLSGVHRSTDGGRTFERHDGERLPRKEPLPRQRVEEVRRQAESDEIGEVLRVLGTGDPGRPYLVVGKSGAWLFARPAETTSAETASAEAASAGEPASPGSRLPLYFPARDIVAAALEDDRLYLGTSGHGLVIVELSAERSAPDAGAKVAR